MEIGSQQRLSKYPIGSIEGFEIVERKCPGGFSQKYIKIDGEHHLLDFFLSGFIPDPRKHVPELRNMEIFDNDILIAAYVKCGTHWVLEMVKMLLKGEQEYEKRPKEVSMLEFHAVDELKTEERPRVFNTHLYPRNIPQAFIEGKGKVLFLLRVSLDWFGYTDSWEKEIQKGKRKYLFIYYEELKKKPVETLKSIATYLEIPCSDALADEIVQKCKIEKMRSANSDKYDDRNQSRPNPEMTNPDIMYRKGQVGDWENYFTVAQNEEFERSLKTRLPESSFKFVYE